MLDTAVVSDKAVAPRVPPDVDDQQVAGLRIATASRPEAVAAEWKQLEASAAVPFASYAWARAWYRSRQYDRDARPLIVLGRAVNGDPMFLLPLVRERRGPFTVLAWPGGKHAAYHGGLFSPECRALVTPQNARQFWDRVRAVLPPSDALAAYGLPAFEIERGNPLGYLPLFNSGCTAYRTALSPDWPTLYSARASAKMRSNDRRCERRLAEHGAVRFHVAQTQAERRRLLDSLIAQKSARFAQLGVPNFFEDPSILGFYQRLADCDDWQGAQSLYLSALELDDVPIAVNLGITQGTCFYGMVLSMAIGEAERFGPGRILLRRSMEHLCGEGFTHYDFGVGEDSYKHLWCEEAIERPDVLVAFNPKGWAFILGLKLLLKTKAGIKQSPLLWRLASRYRRYLGC